MHMIRMTQQRRGFSLTEVLVVVGILALIAAIAAGAYFAVAGGQKQDAAKATMSKIDNQLLRKMKMIRDRIKDDIRDKRAGSGIPELKNAGFSSEAAEAIMLYLRMKNELPMTFQEATTATSITLMPINPGPPITITLPSKAEFKTLTGAPALHLQSAACLFAALGTVGGEGTEQQVGEIEPGSYKCYVSNTKPVIFNRLAYAGDQNELNMAPYAKSPPYDPFFPKKLPNGTYQNLATELGVVNANAFWETVTPVNAAFAVGNANRYVPLVYWGIPRPVGAAAPGNTGYPAGTFHTACAISWGQEGQDVTAPSSLYGNGNIVSYRLREEGARGD
jgi:prepilin-type N-terminal cleavage/methylation domain-containing protein